MFTLKSYNALTFNNTPIKFNTIGEYDLIYTPYTFNNGFKLNLYPFLSGFSDFTFNNKSGIILSNLLNNSQILKDSNIPSLNGNLTYVKTIITDINGNLYKLYKNTLGFNVLKGGYDLNPTKLDELTFIFEKNDIVYIKNYYGEYLTFLDYGPDNLIFTSRQIDPRKENQAFNYVLGETDIILFPNNEIVKNYNAIIIKNRNEFLEVTNNVFSPDSFDYNSFIRLGSYVNSKIDKKSITDSYYTKYISNPVLNENDLLTEKYYDYFQNYLGIFPYENINSDGSYDLYFHGLKNYQTAEYEYSPERIPRIYYNIFSGTNQYKGTDKLYLGYQTNKTLVEFEPDEETGFYFSPTADILDIKNAGFIECGANGGSTPLVSDKIFVSNRSNFGEVKEISNIFKTSNQTENKFLCTWLKGTKADGPKVWYDRYYNSAYYSLNEALSSTHLKYNPESTNNPNPPTVYDVPSVMQFTPGVYYKYHHTGNKNSKDFLNFINYKFTSDGIMYSNTLNVTSYSNKIVDNSIYNNYGISYGNYNFIDNYWKMDGTNYAIFQANDVLLEEKNLTVSIWLNVEDWNNINGYQIFGNYYNSGFGLINEGAAIAPLLTIINNASKTIYNFNCRFGETSKIKTTLNDTSIVQRLLDMSYWVFDTVNATAIKYDISDSVMVGPIKIIGVKQIDQVETDSKQNLYIYDNKLKTYSVYDVDGQYLSTKAVGSSFINRIEITSRDIVYDGNGATYDIQGNCSVLDNDDNLWEIIGCNLYKNKNIVATVGTSMQISCDNYNNIWIISNDDSYSKFDSKGNLIFRYDFRKTKVIPSTNCTLPDYVEDPRSKLVELDEDLPFLSKEDRKTYILTYDKFEQILVSPPKYPKIKIQYPVHERKRVINFINLPIPAKDTSTLTNICGLSSVQNDQLVMVDFNDNQAYIINQLGQLVSKINLEILLSPNETAAFKTGGDFTGYQYIRKFKKSKSTQLNWKVQTKYYDNNLKKDIITPFVLQFDASNLSKGWHNFVLVYDNSDFTLRYYVDSFEVDHMQTTTYSQIFYDYRTPLLLGATSIKNTTLNNFLNIFDGFRFIGSVGEIKMYNIALNKSDIEQLYYACDYAPRIKSLKWNMPVGYRNYIEEVSEWFQFQMPTNKSKYYNINIHNFNVNDEIKGSLELAIRNIIGKLSPAHTLLNKINYK